MWKWHVLVWNRVKIWGTRRHTPTKNSQEYHPGKCWCDKIQLPLISFYFRDGTFSSLIPFFYLDIILLPWCDIFFLDIILLPWYHFTTVMWHFLPWYHFTTVMEHFLPRHNTPGGGEGGGGRLGLFFAGYVPLAFQSLYPIIVFSVANCRPHLGHFGANM